MAEYADTPPALPSSGPPGEADLQENAPRRKSERFKALQKMLSSSGTMYSVPERPTSAPPTKRPHVEDDEPALGSSVKLVHATRDRPKRKVRPPTRLPSRGSIPSIEDRDEEMRLPEVDEPPPPLPPSSIPPGVPTQKEEPPSSSPLALSRLPPDLPQNEPPLPTPASDSLPSPEEQSFIVVDSGKLSLSDDEDMPPLPDSAPLADIPDDLFSKTFEEKIDDDPPINADTVTSGAETTPVKDHSIVKPKQSSLFQKQSSYPTSTTAFKSVTISPDISEKTDDRDAAKIVIGSFSERLKKIRANRTTRGLSSSPISKKSWTPKHDSVSKAEKYAKIPSPSSASTWKQLLPRSPSPPNATATSLAIKHTPESPKFPPKAEPTSYSKQSSVIPNSTITSPQEVLPNQLDVTSSTETKTSTSMNELDGDEEDLLPSLPPDLPPSLPPDLPPLPPPPESPALSVPPLSVDKHQEKTSSSSSSLLDADSGQQLAKRRDEWMKKSEHLDSMILQPLPLLISSKSTHTQEPSNSPMLIEVDGRKSLNSSSESLPSIPDTPPPALPDAPPPELPTSLPPDFMATLSDEDDAPQITAEVLLDRSDTNGSKYSRSPPPTGDRQVTETSESKVVQLRQHRNNNTAFENRQSAFDALIATEPTAEEKNEPKLSIEDRRSLALHAAKRSDGDTKPVLDRWSLSVASSTNTSQESITKTKATEDFSTSPVANTRSLSMETESHLKPPSSSAVPQSLSTTPPKFLSQDYNPLHLRPSSASSDSATKPRRQFLRKFQPSHPSAPNIYQKVKVISEGKPPSSPDLKFTRIARKQWKKPSAHLFDDLSSSASTGNIINAPRSPDLPESSSLTFFGSDESVDFDKQTSTSPTKPNSKTSDEQTSKPNSLAKSPLAKATAAQSEVLEDEDVRVEHTSQGLLAAVMSDLPPMESGESSVKDVIAPVEEVATVEIILEEVHSTPPTVVSQLLQGSEEELHGAMPDRLAELEQLNHEQGELLEEQLAEVREQQKITQDLLQTGPSSFLSDETTTTASRRPPSLQFERDFLEGDPMEWMVEEVCQWLELVGLGMYRQTFRDNQVNGRDLLHADVQLFGDLGIDSPEVREIFLAKIYELSNPNVNMDSIEEDDFLLPVDDYNSEDWKKLQAAVNALKSPLLDESVELEPSAIGQFIHTDYVRSQSTPNIADLDDDATILKHQLSPHSTTEARSTDVTPSVTLSPFPASAPGSKRESTVSSPFRTSTPEDAANFQTALSTVGEWVAGLPQYAGRQRALTDPSSFKIISEPSRKTEQEEAESKDVKASPEKKGATLPASLNKKRDTKNHTRKQKRSSKDEQSTVSEDKVAHLAKEVLEGSITSQEGEFKSEKHDRSASVAMSSSESRGEDKSEIIRLFMDTIQEGTLYKSFLASSTTTAEWLVKEALEKANLNREDPANYCIWQRALVQSATSRLLQPSENPSELQTQSNSHRFELRLKKGVKRLKLGINLPGRVPETLTLTMPSTATCPEAVQLVLSSLGLMEESEREGWVCTFMEVNLQSKDERILGKNESPVAVQSSWGAETRNMLKLTIPTISSPPFTGMTSDVMLDTSHLLAQIGNLERDKSILQQQLDGAHHQLQSKKEKNVDVLHMQESQALLRNELQKQHKAIELELQNRIDELTLGNRKLEEKLQMVDEDQDQANLLSDIQSQYSEEVSELTHNLREKDTALREMRAKLSTTEEELSELQEKSQEIEHVLKLLSDRNQQMKSLEKDLAIKESTIQQFSVQLEEAQLGADQAHAFHKTLQAVETSFKQQQDFANRTTQELKEQVARLTADSSIKEQLLTTLREEKERMAREHQAKEALVSSLEVNLAGYKMLRSASTDEDTKLQAMERSVAALERAMGSLRSEFQKQNSELKSADENVARLREGLAKKQEQLSLLSTTQEPPERCSLYTLMVNQAPHFILTAELVPSEEGVGIKVANDPSGVSGCVIVKISESCTSTGLQIGDKILEVNGADMGMKSQREINKLCQKSKELLRIVVARQLSPDNLEGIDFDSFSRIAMGSSSEMVIERFKKLSTTLNAQLDYQSNELEHWRQECDRLKAEVLKYSTSQKDKESELVYLQSTVKELQQQLCESESARSELRATLEELEVGQYDQQHIEAMEHKLSDKEKEVKKLKAAEKKQASQLKKLEGERNSAIKMLRKHMLSLEDLELPTEPMSADLLSGASRKELLSSLKTMEEDFMRHKVYLDQLLTVVIDQSPEILSRVGEAQTIRDQADPDSWI